MKKSHYAYLTFFFLVTVLLSCDSGEQGAKITSVADIKDKRIGVQIGTTHDQFVSVRFPDATILHLETPSDLALSLKADKCDAIIMDECLANIYLSKYSELSCVAKNIFSEPLGIGFHDTLLRRSFNLFLINLKKNGALDSIINKWLHDDGTAVIAPYLYSSTAPKLYVATTGMDLPFSFIRDRQYVGIEMEMITLFARSIGMKPVFSMLPFASLITALKSKKVDIISGNLTITPERSKEVLFSDCYFYSGACVLALTKNIDKDVTLVEKKSLEKSLIDTNIIVNELLNKNFYYTIRNKGNDITTARIGVLTGGIAEVYMRANYPSNSPYCYDDIADAVASLKADKIKYVLIASTTAMNIVKLNPEIAITDKQYGYEGEIIALQKNRNDNLNNLICNALDEMKADGSIADIMHRWIKTDSSDYDYLFMPQQTEGKVLRVAVSANREPMCFVKNGIRMGAAFDVIETIAFRLGMKIEYMEMKSSALTVSLISRKADVALTNFTPTKERKKQIDFSDVYYINPQVLITKVNDTKNQSVTTVSWWNRVKEGFYNNFVVEKRYKILWDGFKVTLIISLCSVFWGTLLGFAVCYLRMSKNTILKESAFFYISILRKVPHLILLMLMFYVVFASGNISGVIVSIITFSICFSAFVSEMFRTSIESIDKSQMEAGLTLGFSKSQAFFNIVFPQALQRVFPIYKGEFIALVKTTSVVGFVAVEDLTKMSDLIRSRTFDAFFPLLTIAVIYFTLSWILTLLLELINVKMAPHRVNRRSKNREFKYLNYDKS